jgi:hypothetical protein
MLAIPVTAKGNRKLSNFFTMELIPCESDGKGHLLDIVVPLGIMSGGTPRDWPMTLVLEIELPAEVEGRFVVWGAVTPRNQKPFDLYRVAGVAESCDERENAAQQVVRSTLGSQAPCAKQTSRPSLASVGNTLGRAGAWSAPM